jgi:carboxyl-terminal processing protease
VAHGGVPVDGHARRGGGIKPGDRIIEVEGVSTFGWSSERASAALRGEAGTEVALTVLRAGSPEPLRFDIERQRIHVTAVPYADLVQPGIGYVRLETVGAQSADELSDAVARLREAGARALILDLRYNPGGLLDQGVAVADLFLDPGQAVVTTRGRALGTSRTYDADLSQRWGDMPLVVLVNEFSASAAEIVAGALQDHDRALVVGTTSFGKGVVQTIFQISRTEALRLTTSRWYTPSGRSIHRERDGEPFEPASQGAGDSVAVAPEYRSDGGRVLRGGGGIHPDVVVRADTVSETERRFQRQLGSDVQTFVDVISSYALELSGSEAVGEAASFAVTPAMRTEVLRRLRDRGLVMPDATWDGAAGMVNDELRRRVLRYAVGREAEIRDRVAADRVVQRAIELLGDAVTQNDLYRSIQP